MAKSKTIICIVDYGTFKCRDVAQTIVNNGTIEIVARGIIYVFADDEDDFISQCEKSNVYYVIPDA